MAFKRVYKMGGVRLVQRPLTYGQWERIREVAKGKGVGLADMTPEGIGRWMEQAMDARLLPKIATVVLSVYEPTPVHRWLNERAMKRHGEKSLSDIIADSPELPTAVADFFVLNVSWWETWLNTSLRLGWLTKGVTPAQAIVFSTKAFTTLATATSLPLNGGALSPPRPS